jgi:CheY-like chemotaxis protein
VQAARAIAGRRTGREGADGWPTPIGGDRRLNACSAAQVLHGDGPMQTLDGIHVLLVEDHSDSRDIMKMVMEYQGALVVPAPDAKTALRFLATLRPDVLVTDISMPGQDGVELLHEARARGVLDGVPTVAVSAFAPSDKRALEAGFDAYLQKPVDPNQLCTTVQALAHRRKLPGQQ